MADRVSERRQDGSALVGCGNSVVLSCEVCFCLFLEGIVESGDRNKVVGGVGEHA